MLTTHLYLVPILRHEGAIPTRPLNVLMVLTGKNLPLTFGTSDRVIRHVSRYTLRASAAGVWQVSVFLFFVYYFPLLFALVYFLRCTAFKIGSAGSTLHTSVGMHLPSGS
jgi:hypothetical protein